MNEYENSMYLSMWGPKMKDKLTHFYFEVADTSGGVKLLRGEIVGFIHIAQHYFLETSAMKSMVFEAMILQW